MRIVADFARETAKGGVKTKFALSLLLRPLTERPPHDGRLAPAIPLWKKTAKCAALLATAGPALPPPCTPPGLRLHPRLAISMAGLLATATLHCSL